MSDIQSIENQLIIQDARDNLLSYTMGVFPKFIPTDFHEACANAIEDVFEGRNDRLILVAPPRHGKLINSLISLTFIDENGNIVFGKHGDLKPGYKVFHRDGNAYPIVATNDPVLADMRVTFSNGEVIECHSNHEWVVRDIEAERKSRAKHRKYASDYRKKNKEYVYPDNYNDHVWKTLETRELMNLGTSCKGSKPLGQRGYRARFHVNTLSEPMNFPDTELPIDPYWFGYWLGDGKSSDTSICVSQQDKDILVEKLSSLYDITWDTTHVTTDVYYMGFNHQGLRDKLRNLSVIGNKHIPDEYIFTSIENRLQLLAGMIDSDGSVCQKTGRVRFSNANKNVIDTLVKLLHSLGLKPYVTSSEPVMSSSGIQGKQVVYQVGFQSNLEIPTIYERKKVKLTDVSTTVSIVSVTPVPADEQSEGFCIQVDSPDQTYLVGDSMIETHNSVLVSETGPAKFLGKYPDRKVIAASHTQDLADRFGAKVRDNMATPFHEMVFGRAGSLRNKSRAGASSFQTNAGGEFNTVGVGGTPIGKGADIFIIDDPIRSRADVESQLKRDELKAWYSSSVLTRLEGQGGIILMHQRWHEDDLAGWLLSEHADDGWVVLNFPALIETEDDKLIDSLGRDFGEVLIPELHSYEKLIRLRDTMAPRDWLSMYQGQPRSMSGDEFTESHIQRYEQSPDRVRSSCNVYILVDPATTKKKTSDFTSMAVLGVGADGNFYILDGVRERLDLAERTATLMDLHRRWRPNIVGYEGYGMSADIQHIQAEQERSNYRFPIVELQSRVKKLERIRRLIPDMGNGKWYAPKDGIVKVDANGNEYDFVKDLLEEMLAFPVGRHDDALDSVSRIYDVNYTFPSFNTNYANFSREHKKRSPW